MLLPPVSSHPPPYISHTHTHTHTLQLKQLRFLEVLEHTNRTSLNYFDFSATVGPGWMHAHSKPIQERAWREGGVIPFRREPQVLMAWTEAKQDASRPADRTVAPFSSVMSEAQAANWDGLMAMAPGRIAKAMKAKAAQQGGGGGGGGGGEGEEGGGEDGEAEDDGGALALTNARAGAAQIFNCPPDKRIHLSQFMAKVRDIKGYNRTILEKYLLYAKSKDRNFLVTYKSKVCEL